MKDHMSRQEKLNESTQDELTWYTSEGYSVAFLPENASDDTVVKALTAPAYDEDFVGPFQPLMHGELVELSGIRVVSSPPLTSVKPKGPKKHWRRWWLD